MDPGTCEKRLPAVPPAHLILSNARGGFPHDRLPGSLSKFDTKNPKQNIPNNKSKPKIPNKTSQATNPNQTQPNTKSQTTSTRHNNLRHKSQTQNPKQQITNTTSQTTHPKQKITNKTNINKQKRTTQQSPKQ